MRGGDIPELLFQHLVSRDGHREVEGPVGSRGHRSSAVQPHLPKYAYSLLTRVSGYCRQFPPPGPRGDSADSRPVATSRSNSPGRRKWSPTTGSPQLNRGIISKGKPLHPATGKGGVFLKAIELNQSYHSHHLRWGRTTTVRSTTGVAWEITTVRSTTTALLCDQGQHGVAADE